MLEHSPRAQRRHHCRGTPAPPPARPWRRTRCRACRRCCWPAPAAPPPAAPAWSAAPRLRQIRAWHLINSGIGGVRSGGGGPTAANRSMAARPCTFLVSSYGSSDLDAEQNPTGAKSGLQHSTQAAKAACRQLCRYHVRAPEPTSWHCRSCRQRCMAGLCGISVGFRHKSHVRARGRTSWSR